MPSYSSDLLLEAADSFPSIIRDLHWYLYSYSSCMTPMGRAIVYFEMLFINNLIASTLSKLNLLARESNLHVRSISILCKQKYTYLKL